MTCRVYMRPSSAAICLRLAPGGAAWLDPWPLIEMAEADTARSIAQSLSRSDGAETPGERESALLLGCLRVNITDRDDGALRQLLACPLDWTCFARKLTEHNLAAPVAEALLSNASDLLPGDILYAFETIACETRSAPAQAVEVKGSNLPNPVAEDELLMLAAKGMNVSHWDLSWPYGVAVFIKFHP